MEDGHPAAYAEWAIYCLLEDEMLEVHHVDENTGFVWLATTELLWESWRRRDGEQTNDDARKDGKSHVTKRAYHDDPPPFDWGHPESVNGTMKKIAKAMGMDEETVKKKGANGTIWIQQVHSRQYEVFFKNRRQFEQVAGAMFDSSDPMKQDET
jgi:hypothetical protein